MKKQLIEPCDHTPKNPNPSEYIMKIRILDETEGFLNELEKNGCVMMFFADGGAARIEEPDWNEIEDMIRNKKIKQESTE